MKVNRAMAQQFVRAYLDEGRSINSIAEEFALSPLTVYKHLLIHGVEIRGRGLSPEKRKERESLWQAVADGYRNGKSSDVLAAEFGVSASAVQQMVLRSGGKTLNRGEKSPWFLQEAADRDANIARNYRRGATVEELREMFQVSESTVRRAIRKNGAGKRKGTGE